MNLSVEEEPTWFVSNEGETTVRIGIKKSLGDVEQITDWIDEGEIGRGQIGRVITNMNLKDIVGELGLDKDMLIGLEHAARNAGQSDLSRAVWALLMSRFGRFFIPDDSPISLGSIVSYVDRNLNWKLGVVGRNLHGSSRGVGSWLVSSNENVWDLNVVSVRPNQFTYETFSESVKLEDVQAIFLPLEPKDSPFLKASKLNGLLHNPALSNSEREDIKEMLKNNVQVDLHALNNERGEEDAHDVEGDEVAGDVGDATVEAEAGVPDAAHGQARFELRSSQASDENEDDDTEAVKVKADNQVLLLKNEPE